MTATLKPSNVSAAAKELRMPERKIRRILRGIGRGAPYPAPKRIVAKVRKIVQ